MLLLGYGTTSSGEKYLKLKNSWGEDWGKRGYMRLPRGVNKTEGGVCRILTVPLHPAMKKEPFP